MSEEKSIWVSGLTEKEKKKLNIAKAKSGAKTWRDFFLKLVEDDI